MLHHWLLLYIRVYKDCLDRVDLLVSLDQLERLAAQDLRAHREQADLRDRTVKMERLDLRDYLDQGLVMSTQSYLCPILLALLV